MINRKLRPTLSAFAGYSGMLWDALKGVPAIISFAATVAVLLVPRTGVFQARWVLFAVLLLLALIVALLEVGWIAYLRAEERLPRVRHCRTPPPGYGSYPLLCVLEPSDLFSYGDIVALYFLDENDLEQLIGRGGVVNIQQDKSIQVLLHEPLAGQEELLQRLAKNEQAARSRVLVKPNVQRAESVFSAEEPE